MSLARLSELAERDLLEPLNAIAKRHHLLPVEVVGHSRESAICRARDEWVHYLRSELGWSWPTIARSVGFKDHTSAITAVKRAKSRLPNQEITP